jgi:hypothetical protein
MIEPRPEIDRRLAELRRCGVYPVAAIKAIHCEFVIPLAEAKLRFAQSPAWAAQAAAGDQLHLQIFEALDNDVQAG